MRSNGDAEQAEPLDHQLDASSRLLLASQVVGVEAAQIAEVAVHASATELAAELHN
jgi:hypothetical protein